MDIFSLKDNILGTKKDYTLKLLKYSTDKNGPTFTYHLSEPESIVSDFNENSSLKALVIRDKYEFFKIFNKDDELIIYGPIKMKYK